MSIKTTITIEALPGQPSARVIKVSGELDESSLPKLQEIINPVIGNPDILVIIFNFDGLEFMGSSIVGYFAALQSKMNDEKRKVIFSECNQTINDIITFVGLDRVIACHPTLKDAIKITTKELSKD